MKKARNCSSDSLIGKENCREVTRGPFNSFRATIDLPHDCDKKAETRESLRLVERLMQKTSVIFISSNITLNKKDSAKSDRIPGEASPVPLRCFAFHPNFTYACNCYP